MKRIICLAIAGIAMILSDANAQETLDRNQRPGPQPVPQLTLPTIQKTTLANGLAVWLVEQHKLPYVAFSLTIQSGADRDPAGKPGIATMTAEAMDAGTSSMTTLQIADRLNFIGATMSFRAGFDGSYGTLGTLTKHLDEALAVFADVLSNPTFPSEEVERLRKQRLTSLLQQKDRASTIATLAFNHILYGDEHPYGNDPSGTEKSVAAFTRDDLMQFYSTHYRPNNATLIIVGDVTMNEILGKLNARLAGWKSGPVAIRPSAKVPDPGQARIYLIDKPAAPQSEIRIGYPAVARNTPDFFTISLLNHILGGQFSSRINMNLRERRGYTYGARSTFMPLKDPGPFVASGGFVSTKTDSAVHELLYEIARMHDEGMTPEELEFAKKGLTGNFARSFETSMQIAMGLQNLVLYGLPDDYFSTYLQNIQQVTLSDVKAAATKYLDTKKMAIVVVGDVKTIKSGLEKLNAGAVVACDNEGKPLK